jgi:multidrug transporter EmrE-like cation transporter
LLEFLSVIRGEDKMNTIKIVAIILIVAGVLGLVYGGFSYTKKTHSASVGPLELTVTDKEQVNIPIWAGIGAIAIGGGLLLFGNKKS